jgi:hypothetical protein
MFDHLRRGLLAVTRLNPFYADDVGDRTAGGNNHVQDFLDARRHYRGNVADLTARNGLANKVAGDWVMVLSAGGLPRIDVWNGTAWVMLRFTVEPTIQHTFPYTLTAADQELVCASTANANADVTLPANPYKGQKHTVKDGKGDSNVYRVRVFPSGMDLIDGEPYVDLLSEYMSLTFMWNGFQWNIL